MGIADQIGRSCETCVPFLASKAAVERMDVIEAAAVDAFDRQNLLLAEGRNWLNAVLTLRRKRSLQEAHDRRLTEINAQRAQALGSFANRTVCGGQISDKRGQNYRCGFSGALMRAETIPPPTQTLS